MLRYLFLLMIGATFASVLWASDDWPQWRGPNRDAVSKETGLLDSWENSPPLIWKTEGIGNGDAGVVAEGGIVCTVGRSDDKLVVVAVDDRDGKVIWRTEIGSYAQKQSFVGTAQITPTMDGERIYTVSSEGILFCLRTTTGERLWEKSYLQDFNGQTPNEGSGESPLVDGDKLIISPDGIEAGIVALDKKTGEELWRSASAGERKLNEKKTSFSSVIISQGGGSQAVCATAGVGTSWLGG